MKVGRPKLTKGLARDKIINVRLNLDELKDIATKANAKRLTISDYIRAKLGYK